MAKANPSIKFTARDYRNLPESETTRYELLGGELLMTPSPNWEHQRVLFRLAYLLETWARQHDLGAIAVAPLDVELSDEDVVQPDILFVSRERLSIARDDGVHGAPDLIVEVASPRTAERDRSYKRTLYARHGVQAYWLVDPEDETIKVLTLGEAGYETSGRFKRGEALSSPAFPALTVPLDDVFSA